MNTPRRWSWGRQEKKPRCEALADSRNYGTPERTQCEWGATHSRDGHPVCKQHLRARTVTYVQPKNSPYTPCYVNRTLRDIDGHVIQ